MLRGPRLWPGIWIAVRTRSHQDSSSCTCSSAPTSVGTLFSLTRRRRIKSCPGLLRNDCMGWKRSIKLALARLASTPSCEPTLSRERNASSSTLYVRRCHIHQFPPCHVLKDCLPSLHQTLRISSASRKKKATLCLSSSSSTSPILKTARFEFGGLRKLLSFSMYVEPLHLSAKPIWRMQKKVDHLQRTEPPLTQPSSTFLTYVTDFLASPAHTQD